MQITGNIAHLSDTEQRMLGIPESPTFMARIRCSDTLADAQREFDALKRGDEPMAYVPAEILENRMVNRGLLLLAAGRRLKVVTDIAAQVLVYEAEQHLRAQANGTAIEGL